MAFHEDDELILNESEVKKLVNHGPSITIGTSPVPLTFAALESLADFWLHIHI